MFQFQFYFVCLFFGSTFCNEFFKQNLTSISMLYCVLNIMTIDAILHQNTYFVTHYNLIGTQYFIHAWTYHSNNIPQTLSYHCSIIGVGTDSH